MSAMSQRLRSVRLHDDDIDPRWFWPLAFVGGLVVAYGAWRFYGTWSDRLGPWRYLRWTVGLAVLHDLVIGPLCCAVGLVLVRVLKPPFRAPVQAAAIASAIVTATAWPLVRGWGRDSNVTALPRDYGQGLLIVLGVVWLTAAVVVAAMVVRRRAT